MSFPTCTLLTLAAAVAITAGEPAAVPPAVTPPAQPSLRDALVGGNPMVALRYRYEQVNQRGFSNEAHASTLRAAIGYQTKPWHGLSLLAQYEGVFLIGQQIHNDSPVTAASNPYARFPQALDPDGSELNQAHLKYVGGFSGAKLTAKAGRQELILNNARIIGNIAWRQNQQTFDAVSGVLQPLAGIEGAPGWAKELTLTAAAFSRVNRITGDKARGTGAGGAIGAGDGVLDVNGHLWNLGTKVPGRIMANAYGVFVQYPDVVGQSTATYGLRLEGPWKLSDTFAVPYAVEVARQRDLGNNPADFEADYLLIEAGLAWKQIALRFAWNRMEGSSAGDAFNTPLATGHAFNGWAEKFLGTPARGLESHAIFLGGPLPQVVDGLRFLVAGYRFYAQTGHAHYGDEIDANLEYSVLPFDKNLVLGVKVGCFRDDESGQGGIGVSIRDTTKTSLYAAWSY